MGEIYYGALETTPLHPVTRVQHPALDFFRNLTQKRSWWQRLCVEIEMPEALRIQIENLSQETTSLEDLNKVTLEILADQEMVDYLNKILKQDAKKSLLVDLIRTLCGSASIAEFALNNAKITEENISALFGISIPPWLLFTLAIICIIANGPFLAAIFKECFEQIYDIIKRIKGVFNSTMPWMKKVLGIQGWILLELLVYTFGFFSAAGDYKQAFGINWLSFLTTVITSFLNGVISFYGFKEPFVDFFDYLKQGHSLRDLFTVKNCISLVQILGLSLVAYVGIAPPAFLAQQYENGSFILMSLTQAAAIGASLLFSYKVIEKNSIIWPQQRDQKIVVASSAIFYLFSGLNMLAAFTMLAVDKPSAPLTLMGCFCAIVFFCAGIFNGMASVPISTQYYAHMQQAFAKNPAYKKLIELYNSGENAQQLQPSRESLEVKLEEGLVKLEEGLEEKEDEEYSADNSKNYWLSFCAPAPRLRQDYVIL